jgi:hypothetical protein
MPNMQKHAKYAKTCKIKFHIFNRGTLKWISVSFSIKYNFARLICKSMNLRALLIIVIKIQNKTFIHSKKKSSIFAV